MHEIDGTLMSPFVCFHHIIPLFYVLSLSGSIIPMHARAERPFRPVDTRMTDLAKWMRCVPLRGLARRVHLCHKSAARLSRRDMVGNAQGD
ncbi:hypothetical protein RRG08_024253 [Elysia crispata]|uniref:Uncharacterized protein n=1 Tax=Elysia crispata TaxID=231223 RepID=A0AAE1D8N0_9GAST|nr:hypothetical protein RRG08_024253 [Elysia crispata]